MRPRFLIFDMDDTLVRTQTYITYELRKFFYENNKCDMWYEMKAHLRKNGGLNLPEHIRKYVMEEVILKKKFMSEALPSRLFNYYFLVPGNLDRGRQVAICTHRAWAKDGHDLTAEWLDKQKPCIDVSAIHCLDPKKNPDKIEYLKKHYGDDFLLVDDNPFGDVETVRGYDKNVVIYDEYGKYPSHKNQSRLVYKNGVYKRSEVLLS